MAIDFLFDGKNLSGYGYIICSFDGISTETVTASNITFQTIKAPFSNVSKKTSATYEDNLQTTFCICKNPSTTETLELTADDIAELTKWLCRKEYKWFSFVNAKNGMDEVYYEAQINTNKVMLGDTCIGLELIITTNRPYGLTSEHIIKSSLDSENKTIEIHVYSDEEGYIYPDCTITLQESGTLEILNELNGEITIITNCTAGEIIKLYGDILQIETSDASHSICDCFNYTFPRLCHTVSKSSNTLSVNLSCDMELKYRGIRKVGI